MSEAPCTVYLVEVLTEGAWHPVTARRRAGDVQLSVGARSATAFFDKESAESTLQAIWRRHRGSRISDIRVVRRVTRYE